MKPGPGAPKVPWQDAQDSTSSSGTASPGCVPCAVKSWAQAWPATNAASSATAWMARDMRTDPRMQPRTIRHRATMVVKKVFTQIRGCAPLGRKKTPRHEAGVWGTALPDRHQKVTDHWLM